MQQPRKIKKVPTGGKRRKPTGKRTTVRRNSYEEISRVSKNASPPRKRPQKITKKRRRKRNMTVYYIVFFMFFSGIIAVLANTILFNVDEFILQGESFYSKDEIISASGIGIGKNLLHFNGDKVAENIYKELYYLDEVKVQKKFPNSVKIVISPAIGKFIFQGGGEEGIVSKNYRLLEKGSADEPLILIKGIDISQLNLGDVISEETSSKMWLIPEIISNSQQQGLDNITEVNIEDEFNISFTYDNRVVCQLGSSEKISQKITVAKETIENKIENNVKAKLILQDPSKVYITEIR